MACNDGNGMMNGGPVTDWTDWQNAPPRSPFKLIANVSLGPTQGVFDRVAVSSAGWIANTMEYDGEALCWALQDDNHHMTADAAQWNFRHKTVNLAASTPLSLQQAVFLRAGTQWRMDIPIDLGVTPLSDLSLTFRDNYATRGDAQGTIPVISFAGSPGVGLQMLGVTLNYTPGRVFMALVGEDAGGNRMMFPMEWIIVP